MTSSSLFDKYTTKTSTLPDHIKKNSLIVAQSILLSKSVNLNQVKDKVPLVTGNYDNKASADYKRLTRYFDIGKIETTDDRILYNELLENLRTLCWVVLFNQKKGKGRKFRKKDVKYLLLDGTKWDFGKDHIHLLTLCITIDDVAIPIWWEDIEKAGHSSQEERINYLHDALQSYQLKGLTLIADREYIGYEWFKELKRLSIHFVIRVKEGIYHTEINQACGRSWDQMKVKASGLKKGKKVSKRIKLDGLELQYIILKNPRPDAEDELIYLVSDLDSPTQAARIYAFRWSIEVCFKHLKKNGFNLEKMSVRGKEKRHLMMVVAVLVYILAIREGLIEEYNLKNKVHHKKDKYTGYYYRAISVFRKGISILFRSLGKWKRFTLYLKDIIQDDFYYLIPHV